MRCYTALQRTASDAAHCYTYSVWSVCLSVGYERSVSPANTDEPIDMPFRTRTGPRNHVLGGARVPPPARKGHSEGHISLIISGLPVVDILNFIR